MNELIQVMRDQQQKQYESAKGFIEMCMQNSRTVEERVFVCPSCHKTKHQEGTQFCSSGFHLDIPKGYKMVQGRLEKL